MNYESEKFLELVQEYRDIIDLHDARAWEELPQYQKETWINSAISMHTLITEWNERNFHG